MKQIFTLLILLFSFIISHGQQGSLDASFASGGKLTTDFGPSFLDKANALAVQSDGKIVSAGSTFNPAYKSSFALSRHNINGSPDITFGVNGRVVTDFGSHATLSALALQSDRKIVAAGRLSSEDIAIARYNTDGSPDNNFDGDGKLILDIRHGDDIRAMAIQTDGKIILAGCSRALSGGPEFTLVRLMTNGSLDLSFNGTGYVITHLGAFNHFSLINAIALQNDGKIVVAGTSGYDYDVQKFALARYDTNGSLDGTFNGSGAVITSMAYNDYAYGVAIQGDGKILIAGFTYNTVDVDYAILRYNADGTLDMTYDEDGKVITSLGTSTDIARAIALQSDGKAVVAGFSGSANTQRFSLARYNTNGSLDVSFGNAGIITTSFNTTGNINGQGAAVAIYMNRIYVAGEVLVPGSLTNYDFALLAYQKDVVPLPVTLLNFSAAVSNAGVKCTWQTAQQVNVSHFILQRSTDGARFDDAGKLGVNPVYGASYSYTDDLPSAIRQLPILYYRLQMVDKDGQFTYSQVATIEHKQTSLATVFPNPAQRFISVNGKNLQTVRVFDHSGKQVYSKMLSGGLQHNLSISHLARGTYTLVITTTTGDTQTKTLILQ